MNRFNGLLVFLKTLRRLLRRTCPANDTKPLKRFLWFSRSFITGLKPGVNESKTLQTFEAMQYQCARNNLRKNTR